PPHGALRTVTESEWLDPHGPAAAGRRSGPESLPALPGPGTRFPKRPTGPTGCPVAGRPARPCASLPTSFVIRAVPDGGGIHASVRTPEGRSRGRAAGDRGGGAAPGGSPGLDPAATGRGPGRLGHREAAYDGDGSCHGPRGRGR